MKAVKVLFTGIVVALFSAGVAFAAPSADRMSRLGFRGEVYSPYGLSFDAAKRAWTYQGKVVGLFEDDAAYGKIFLSPAGEVNLFTQRDGTGKLTGLRTLSKDEYQAALEKIDKQQVRFHKAFMKRFGKRGKNLRKPVRRPLPKS
jgi:hypothetical protein